jgi:hypothetical protein
MICVFAFGDVLGYLLLSLPPLLVAQYSMRLFANVVAVTGQVLIRFGLP